MTIYPKNFTADQIQPGVWLDLDDQSVKRTLASHNKLSAVSTRWHEQDGCNRNAVCWQDDNFYFAALCCFGNILPSDNGYSLLIMAKSHVDTKQAAELVHALFESGIDPNGPRFNEELETKEENN